MLSAGLENALNALLLDDGQQACGRSTRALFLTLPLAERAGSDVEDAGEYGLTHVRALTHGNNLGSARWLEYRRLVEIFGKLPADRQQQLTEQLRETHAEEKRDDERSIETDG